MPEIDIEVDASVAVTCSCEECGKDLNCTLDFTRGEIVVSVSVCPECLEKVAEASHKDGYDDGFANGLVDAT